MEPTQNSQEQSQVSRQGETSRSPRTTDRRVVSSQSSIVFREIHKNAWLKKLPPFDKRYVSGPKKAERVWVVFCVHDDVEAFLELYPDQRVAGAHRPEKSFSLNNCRHVSPTICAQGDDGEFEFVVTLAADHVRLIAPSWDIMMEWVETIQAKLREMKILSPKENIYSRMPEARIPAGPLAPTRDPNSPLPPRPLGPAAATAGLESQPPPSSAPVVTQDGRERENIFFPESSSQGNNVILRNSSTTSLYITQTDPPIYSRPHRTLCRASSVPAPETTESSTVPSTPNVTIIEVSATSGESTRASPALRLPVVSESRSTVIFNFSQMENALPEAEEPTQARESSPASSTPNYAGHIALDSPQIITNSPFSPSRTTTTNTTTTTTVEVPGYASPLPIRPSLVTSYIGRLVRSSPVPRSQFYDTPEGRETANANESSEAQSTAASRSQFYDLAEGREDANADPSLSVVTNNPESAEDSERSLYERVYVPLSIPNQPPPPTPPAIRARRQNARENSEGTGNAGRTAVESPVVPSHANEVNARGQVSSGDGGNTSERRLMPPPQPYRQHISESSPVSGTSGVRLTLREQQVRQLRKEMSHPGGVRLQLRRKDCVNSIALVDALGCVWIAGWKQRERPMLYNVLHFGDQLLSVCGVRVQSAVDAQRLVRGASGLYVELLIRRLPYGRVYAVQRDGSTDTGSANSAEGLGLILEGGTAEVRTVVPGGPAARAGLPPRAPTADGLSICPWVLTEVNSRPLNPFFRDGEPAMRLGAIGGEVSLLVQPSDLARRLRKQLKAMRSYKDYIVQ